MHQSVLHILHNQLQDILNTDQLSLSNTPKYIASIQLYCRECIHLKQNYKLYKLQSYQDNIPIGNYNKMMSLSNKCTLYHCIQNIYLLKFCKIQKGSSNTPMMNCIDYNLPQILSILGSYWQNSYNIDQDSQSKKLSRYKSNIHSLKKNKIHKMYQRVNIHLHIQYKQMMMYKFDNLLTGYYKMCSLFLGEDILGSRMCKQSLLCKLNILMYIMNTPMKLNNKDQCKRGKLTNYILYNY